MNAALEEHPETPPARVRLSLEIGPLSSVLGDVAGLLGESTLALLGMFHPPVVARRANVVITELVTNVLENVAFDGSSFTLDLQADEERVVVAVTNEATPEQYAHVRERVERVQSVTDAKALLASTIRERRHQRLRGGLGLTRLVAENRFALAVDYQGGRMTVRAEHVWRSTP
jgi:hypothetical protein